MNHNDTTDKIYCRECSLPYRVITAGHLKKQHNMTYEEYKTKYPTAPLTCSDSTKMRAEGVSKALKGKPSPHRGRIVPEITRRRITEALTGKKLSESHKQSLKDAIQRNKDNGTYVHPKANYVMTEEYRQKCADNLRLASKIRLESIDNDLKETIKQYNLEFIESGERRRWTVLCLTCNNPMTFERSMFTASGKPDKACPICFPRNGGVSCDEQEVTDYIKTIYDGTVTVNNYGIISGFELDIYAPALKMAIEYNGLYWHAVNSNPQRKPKHISIKTKYAYSNGIQLSHIFSDEWNSSKDAVKDELNKLFKVVQPNITDYQIFRMECDEPVIQFIEDNSLLVTRDADICYVAAKDDEIIGCALYTTSSIDSYNLIGIVNKNFHSIDNLEQNLIDQFVEDYSPKEIIVYADNRYWTNSTYFGNYGFEYVEYKDPIPWLTKDFKSRIHPDTFPDKSLEDMRELGYDWIYDCGYSVWKLTI